MAPNVIRTDLLKDNYLSILTHLKHFMHFKKRRGILLPKFFLPAVRKNCCSDREKLLKFKADGQEFARCLRSLEQFIQRAQGQNNF